MKGGHYISPDGKFIVEIRKIREGLDYKFHGNYVVNTDSGPHNVGKKEVLKKMKNWTKLERRKFRRKKKNRRSKHRGRKIRKKNR